MSVDDADEVADNLTVEEPETVVDDAVAECYFSHNN